MLRHLELVAARANEFAAAFDAGEWGELAGLWHDLGKYRPEFQQRLFGEAIQVEHAGAGAVRAYASTDHESLRDPGLALAFAIAGHHAGLANLVSSATLTPLSKRLDNNRDSLQSLRPDVPDKIWDRKVPPFPKFLLPSCPETSFDDSKRRLAFFTRMLFSALVDADSLETERFYGQQPLRQQAVFDSMQVLKDRLDEKLDRKSAEAPASVVNLVRASVLAECRASAAKPPGFFSLTVPTGGGKTLSGMSFALNHAVARDLRRVIIVVPYTTIIEQNAAVYRDFLGDHNVVEHHSNLDDFADVEQGNELAIRRRLACENWDAPLIVTTNVQFFESLFANKKSRCRKLHNIARSVVVLDEAQNLPVEFLHPVLEALRELTQNYGCTVVLSTATQPALEKRKTLPTGLENVTEIATSPIELGNQLRRVNLHWPDRDSITTYADLAEGLARRPAVLAVVHRRLDAVALARLVARRCPDEQLFHLSALMCPAHRRETIESIQQQLTLHRHDGRPCRVVSTQLVESGVDLDFPVCYRALAGLDSLAQAAGRCNREGKLAQGEFYVFQAETDPPGPTLKRAIQTTQLMLKLRGGVLDICEPTVFKEYFERFYANEELDSRHILRELSQLNFDTVGQTFRLIEDGYQKPIVIPWDPIARRRIKRLRSIDHAPFAPRQLLRSLQPYTVQVQPRQFDALRSSGALESFMDETVWVLNAALFPKAYDDQLGLIVDAEHSADVEALVV